MILNKNDKETDSFLDINNDITRIIKVMNECQDLKKLLKITTKKPLEHKAEIKEDFRDKQIGRQPILPFDENEGSIIVVTLVLKKIGHITPLFSNRYFLLQEINGLLMKVCVHYKLRM